MKEAKNKFRKEILAMRDSIPLEERNEKSIAAEEQLFNLDAFRAAHTVMFFISFRSEIFTESMIRRAIREGKRVLVPISILEDHSLLPSAIEDYDNDLAPGTYGIPEPRREAVRPVDAQEIDFLILPGAAFDRAGNRIGYAGGYYDRFVERLRSGVPLVALAFSDQIVDSVPTEGHDRPVDYVVTDKEVITCS